MKAEQFLVNLRELYKEFEDDKESTEYQTLLDAYKFISYNMENFQKYLDETRKDN